ncbi:MAG TPA: zf-HC2 domain-containing protein [Actinomycetota bacterium]|nr:zf-HC2 domain-containing protein [Actinomycetota bacterium]
MNEHPDHLLAEYVDGALSQEDRAGVEAHVASCGRCRDEVGLARQALEHLRAAPPVEPPFGLTREVVRTARRPALWQRPVAWAALGSAAAVVAGGLFLATRDQPIIADGALTPASVGAPERDAPTGASIQEEGGEASLASAPADLPYPVLRASPANHTPTTLGERARALATESRSALDGGFPPNATVFYSNVRLRDVDPPIAEALRCASAGTPPDTAAVPFVIETVRFEGIPAYLVSFLRGEGPDAPYDQIQLLVVDRESCTLRHFSRQRL